MHRHSHAKQERIIEAVRQDLEGDAAVEFVRQNGFAMSSAGVARHLHKITTSDRSHARRGLDRRHRRGRQKRTGHATTTQQLGAANRQTQTRTTPKKRPT